MRGQGADLLRSLVEAEQREQRGLDARAGPIVRVVARVRRLVGARTTS